MVKGANHRSSYRVRKKTTSRVSADESFDFLLTIIEHAEEHAVDEGEEADDTRLFRLENYLLKVKNNQLIRVGKTPFPRELIDQIHYLEDGRCEVCGQAMDKKVADIQRVDKTIFCEMDNYKLVCLDCKRKLPNALLSGQFKNSAINYYAKRRDIPFEQAMSELEELKERFVLIDLVNDSQPYSRIYWLNGVGQFRYSQGKIEAQKLYYQLNISDERFGQRSSRNLKR